MVSSAQVAGNILRQHSIVVIASEATQSRAQRALSSQLPRRPSGASQGRAFQWHGAMQGKAIARPDAEAHAVSAQFRRSQMHDIVIRGGTLLDGTGAAEFTGDVAVDGGKIAQVGGKAGPGKREIAADGLLVTPGWVDVHTHYDGQATWDPVLAPSSWHGVTTILFGNCGVGFAPVRKEHRTGLIDLMEAVEDIPGTALHEGLSWDWESFPDFLDALDRMPRTIDIAAQIPHHPLRVYVMGQRAIDREVATPDDIAEMRQLVEAGLRAGAFGFTTSRTYSHKTKTGDLVPGHFAEEAELFGIARPWARPAPAPSA
jgi:N-acyl-D-aspartate/D-glutamate deacylase